MTTRFGLIVRRHRMSTGLSQEGLAGAAGLDRTYISSLERGRRNPTLMTQQRLADALGCTLSSLIHEAEEL
ncbi:helix-turn-helix domain-containing protein [Antricoccus suffuscus]|nr:helix-turn-helix transcriptional regulator [Antricoccus suffuscus]